MTELALASLVERGIARRIDGDADVSIRGIKHDSRKVEPGDLFVAMAGVYADGSSFAADAVARGAAAVACEDTLALRVPVVIVDDAQLALAHIAQLLYGDPTAKLQVVGITGTNGKTTTAYLIESVLQQAGKPTAVIGTVNFRGPAGVLPATHTTPMADDMMRLSRWALDSGATHLVLEVSSHALDMHRVDGVHFEVAVFTNLTQDHLDYHKDFASYEKAKQRLFDVLAPRNAVCNVDDAVGVKFAKVAAAANANVLRCSRSADSQAEIKALDAQSTRAGITARVVTPHGELALSSPLIGEHNLENLLCAIGACLALGIELPQIEEALRTAQGAPGRLQRVEHPSDVLVFVDYAHTPDALARVLTTVRKTTTKRLIVVFGCGGDRDAGKRPLMGKASAELADLVIITSDNPRSEAPQAIVDQIEAGVAETSLPRVSSETLPGSARGYVSIVERRAAIAAALRAAGPGDSVLIAGKGHEKVQIIGKQQLPFDDCQVAAELIAQLGARN